MTRRKILKKVVQAGLGSSTTLAYLVLAGCNGGSGAGPAVVPDEAKTTAKYRELHPELFKSEKKKKGKRGR